LTAGREAAHARCDAASRVAIMIFALPPNPGLGAEDAGKNFFAFAASM
jgi:hypothetical protein